MTVAPQVDQLPVTSRAAIRAASGVGLHTAWPGPYENPKVAQWVIDSGLGLVRDRYVPGNKHQSAVFSALATAGVGLCLFVADLSTTPKEAADNVEALAREPFAGAVRAILGVNEPNAGGGDTWAPKAVALQEAISQAAAAWLPMVPVVSCVLKRNVGKPPGGQQYDDDMATLKAAGVLGWCVSGDHHFYPGNDGPQAFGAEQSRVKAAIWGERPLWESETGWTGAQTNPDLAARFCVEALLRNFAAGLIATLLYELCDNQTAEGKWSGQFGLLDSDGAPKESYAAVQALLTPADGGEAFPGWIAPHPGGAPADVASVVTSDGGQAWTLYLLRNDNATATLVIPPEFQSDAGSFTLGDAGRKRYLIPLVDSMTVVKVTAV